MILLVNNFQGKNLCIVCVTLLFFLFWLRMCIHCFTWISLKLTWWLIQSHFWWDNRACVVRDDFSLSFFLKIGQDIFLSERARVSLKEGLLGSHPSPWVRHPALHFAQIPPIEYPSIVVLFSCTYLSLVDVWFEFLTWILVIQIVMFFLPI